MKNILFILVIVSGVFFSGCTNSYESHAHKKYKSYKYKQSKITRNKKHNKKIFFVKKYLFKYKPFNFSSNINYNQYIKLKKDYMTYYNNSFLFNDFNFLNRYEIAATKTNKHKTLKIKHPKKLSRAQVTNKKSLRRITKAKKVKIAHTKKIKKSNKYKRKLTLLATAYTSHRSQTDSTPFLAAWNNRIRPGMKIIAVSHDLVKKYGLKNGVKVKIKGLKGHYIVKDKMNRRFKKRIDIYMGLNKKRALKWGKRRVELYY